jgi:type I restriction enzyme S subunit
MFMYFVDECYRRQAFFGRLMAVKNYFLLHYILEINPQLAHFKRLPKGPHDPEFWDRLENLLVEKGWISIEEPNKEKKNVKYMPNRSIEYKSVLKEQFGDGWETVQKVVNEMADKDSQHAEVLATVYAAWNDLMIFGKEPSEEKILNEVLNHWPGEEKQKIPESAWRRGIKKLERLGIAPAGFGKPTRDQMKLL